MDVKNEIEKRFLTEMTKVSDPLTQDDIVNNKDIVTMEKGTPIVAERNQTFTS